jgi:hypothetical protein
MAKKAIKRSRRKSTSARKVTTTRSAKKTSKARKAGVRKAGARKAGKKKATAKKRSKKFGIGGGGGSSSAGRAGMVARLRGGRAFGFSRGTDFLGGSRGGFLGGLPGDGLDLAGDDGTEND